MGFIFHAALCLVTGIVCTMTGLAEPDQAFPVSVMDTENIAFSVDDSSTWCARKRTDSDGYVLASGQQTSYQSSTLCASVKGAGTLSFAWKMAGSGYFTVYVDGTPLDVNGGNGYSYGRQYRASIDIRGDVEDEHYVEWEVYPYSGTKVDLLELSDFGWADAAESMTVTFDVNGGTEIDPMEFYAYEYVWFCDLPEPEREGYDFYGWYYDKDLLRPVEPYSCLSFENITLYARWMRPVSLLDTDALSFSSGEWSVENGEGEDGRPAVMSSVRSNGSGELRVGVPCENGTLSFRARTPNSARIRWEVRYGCEHDWKFKYSYGSAALQNGWNTCRVESLVDKSLVCGEEVEGCPTLEVWIYANGGEGSKAVLCDFEWTPAPETVKVHFDTLCDAKVDPIDVPAGAYFPASSLPVPTNNDWTFEGWYTIDDDWGAEPVEDEISIQLHDITLVAGWRLPVSVLDTDTMIFSSSDGWTAKNSQWSWWNSSPDANLVISGSFHGDGEEVDKSYVPKSQKQTLTATVVGPAIVSFGLNFFVENGWYDIIRRGESTLTVSLDDRKLNIWNGSGSEDVKISVPSGTHAVTVELSGTPSVCESDWWSEYDEETDDYVYHTVYALLSPNVKIFGIKYFYTGPRASFGEWLTAVRNGGWIPGDLPRFTKEYAERIADDPHDWEARVLHAASILAQLAEHKSVETYAKKFGFTLDYLGMKAEHKDVSPSSWPAVNAIVDDFMKEGVPVLKAALSDLEGIPSDWKGSVVLSAEEYPVDEDVSLDVADVLYARAGIEAAIGLAYFAHGYDLTADYSKGKAACKFTRTIPVANTMPSMTSGEGWEGALKTENGIAFLISGTKLYIGIKGGRVHDQSDQSLDDEPQGDASSLREIFVTFKNMKEAETSYALWLFDEADGPQDSEPQYRAVFGKESDVGAYRNAYFNEESDASSTALLKKLYQPDFTISKNDEDRSLAVAFDFAGKKVAIAAETLAVERGNLEIGIDDDSGYRFDILDMGEIDSDPARLRKLITEQTKFMAKVRNQSSLATSKTWMTAAFTCALNADAAVQDRTDDAMHFIEYDPIDEADIEKARNLTQKALDSLAAPQEVDVQEEVLSGHETKLDVSLLPNDGLMQVYLGALFEGKITRDLLPVFQKGANEAPVPVIETIKDPTLAGLLPDFAAKTWSRLVQSMGYAVSHQTISLKLDGNGGKLPKGAPTAILLDFDEESEECRYPKLPVPTRAGFIFTGWATAKAGGTLVRLGDVYDAVPFAGVKVPTLYAQWLKLYTFTVKGEEAGASWDWSEEQRATLPEEALAGGYEKEVNAKGAMAVPEGAVVNVSTDEQSKDKKGNPLVFQKWTVSSAKANLGPDFYVTSCEAQLTMPAEKLTLTATYIDESTCGTLSAYASAWTVEFGRDEEAGTQYTIEPPHEAFEWSPDGGKTWYKAKSFGSTGGEPALLKAGAYTVTWRSADPNWQAPSSKTKTTVSAGEEKDLEGDFTFTYVPQVVVDVMELKNGELRESSVAGTVTVNPKDGFAPVGKTIALTAKAAKGYAFQGWTLADDWTYDDGFWEASATWKFVNSESSTSQLYFSPNPYIDPVDKKVHVKAIFKAFTAYSADDIVFNGIGSYGFGGYYDYYSEALDNGSGSSAVTIKAMVGCPLDNLKIDCGLAASPLAYKLSGKLPDGLKFDAKTGIFSGAPKKPGDTTVTITATDPAKNARDLTINFSVNPLPSWLVGEYRGMLDEGYYEEGDCEGNCCTIGEFVPGQQNGIVELSVKSDGKVSAKVGTRLGTVSLSGTLAWYPDDEEDSDGTFSFWAYKGDSSCDVDFNSDGTIYGHAYTYQKADMIEGRIAGMRQDTTLLTDSPFLGKYYTFAFCATTTENSYYWDNELGHSMLEEVKTQSGYGYLTIKTDAKGGAKVTGQLPDGEKVSMSALVMPFITNDVLAVRLHVFASPSSYKKHDWFAMSLVIAPDGTVKSEECAAWTPADLEGGYDEIIVDPDGQDAEVFGDGALYSEAKSLENYYWAVSCEWNDNVRQQYSWKEYGETYYDNASAYAQYFDDCGFFFNVAVKGDAKGAISLVAKSPAPWVEKNGGESFWNYDEDKNGNEITDPSQLSISFAKATGIFTGKANVYFDYPKPTSASLPYSGVMIYEGEGGYVGRGSAVYTYKYSYQDDSGKAKSDTKKVTLPVSLTPPNP